MFTVYLYLHITEINVVFDVYQYKTLWNAITYDRYTWFITIRMFSAIFVLFDTINIFFVSYSI